MSVQRDSKWAYWLIPVQHSHGFRALVVLIQVNAAVKRSKVQVAVHSHKLLSARATNMELATWLVSSQLTSFLYLLHPTAVKLQQMSNFCLLILLLSFLILLLMGWSASLQMFLPEHLIQPYYNNLTLKIYSNQTCFHYNLISIILKVPYGLEVTAPA